MALHFEIHSGDLRLTIYGLFETQQYSQILASSF